MEQDGWAGDFRPVRPGRGAAPDRRRTVSPRPGAAEDAPPAVAALLSAVAALQQSVDTVARRLDETDSDLRDLRRLVEQALRPPSGSARTSRAKGAAERPRTPATGVTDEPRSSAQPPGSGISASNA